MSGRLVADAADLGAVRRNLGALLGRQLPAVAGKARVEAALSGTERAPALRATGTAPTLRAGRASRSRACGSSRARRGRCAARLVDVEGGAAAVRLGAEEIARALAPRPARERGGERLRVRGASCGRRQARSPSTRAAGSDRAATASRSPSSTLAYPGARWRLDHPATIRFEGPAMDRLELVTGEQRISVEGGLGARGALDAHVELVRVDLTRLPPGVIPRNLGVAGVLSADARATGTTRRPRLAARFELEGGAVRGLAGLHGAGSGSWDGRARRASATLAVERAGGGAVDVSADVPRPARLLAGGAARRAHPRAGAPGRARPCRGGSGHPLEGILALDGDARRDLRGVPRLSAEASLEKGAYQELRPFAIAATLENPGEQAELRATATYDGRARARVEGGGAARPRGRDRPPGVALAGAADGAARGERHVPGLDLARSPACSGCPTTSSGTLAARATLDGQRRGAARQPHRRPRARRDRGLPATWARASASRSRRRR